MAPVKFEENIKNKLEERTLKPSENSWDQLSSRLDNENKKGFSKYWWLAIAAVIIIMFQVGVNSNQNIIPENSQPQLVEEPDNNQIQDIETESKAEQNMLPINSNNEAVVEIVPTQLEVEEKLDEVEKSQTRMASLDKSSSQSKPSIVESSSLDLKTDKKYSALNPSIVAENEVNQLLEEVIKGNTSKNMDKEVDSLLKAAQKEIFKENVLNRGKNVVNAQNLLMEVETEVEPSLKSKVYKALKGGYQKVKTAVAERNN